MGGARVPGAEDVVIGLGEVPYSGPEGLPDHGKVPAGLQHRQAPAGVQVLFQKGFPGDQVPDGGPVGGHRIPQPRQLQHRLGNPLGGAAGDRHHKNTPGPQLFQGLEVSFRDELFAVQQGPVQIQGHQPYPLSH